MPEGRLQRTRRNQPELSDGFDPIAAQAELTLNFVKRFNRECDERFVAAADKKKTELNGDVSAPTHETPWGV